MLINIPNLKAEGIDNTVAYIKRADVQDFFRAVTTEEGTVFYGWANIFIFTKGLNGIEENFLCLVRVLWIAIFDGF